VIPKSRDIHNVFNWCQKITLSKQTKNDLSWSSVAGRLVMLFLQSSAW